VLVWKREKVYETYRNLLHNHSNSLVIWSLSSCGNTTTATRGSIPVKTTTTRDNIYYDYCPIRSKDGKRCRNKAIVWLNYAKFPGLNYLNRNHTICRYHSEYLLRCRFITREDIQCRNPGKCWINDGDFPDRLLCEYHYDILTKKKKAYSY
jgi:hypothetical protein